MIGIIAAMDEERDAFLSRSSGWKTEKRNGVLFYRGQIGDKDVVLTKCGIGKANAAMTAALLILKYHPELVINIGCAGSLSKDVNVGDIVIGTVVADWDMDIPSDNWIRGFECANLCFRCAEVSEDIRKDIPAEYNVHFGPIVSGDSFIYKKSQVNTILKYYPGTQCGEMEGSSIGRVCANFKVPFNIIRSISDATLVQGDYRNFDFNLAKACENAAVLTEVLLRR